MQTLQKYIKTELGKIPKEWSIVQIQDICKTSSGGTPSRNNSNYYNGNIPWIKTGELKDGYIFETEEHISAEALKFSSAKLFPPDTLLFAMYGATIGKTAITKISATTNQACCAFLPLKKETVNPYFLQQYFILVRHTIISKGEGAGQPNTSQDFLKTFRIIYPPFREQQKISSILSNVDELIQKTEQIIKQTQRLKKGLMQRLLTKGIGHTKFKKTEIGEIAEEWQLIKMKEIVESYKNGIYKKSIFYGRGVLNIRMFNIQNGDVNTENTPLLEVTKEELLDYGLRPGDILLNRVNSMDLVGKAGILHHDIGPSVFDSMIIRIRLNNRCMPQFLNYFLNTKKYFMQIQAKVKHAIGQSSLNQDDLNSLSIGLPRIDEQKKIVTILTTFDNHIKSLIKINDNNKKLKHGLMQQLLTGKIRVKV
jgi:type I restriction enzyme S subunit